jgi:hypothetical protein
MRPVTWQNMFSPPSVGSIKPKPFSSFHFSMVPLGIAGKDENHKFVCGEIGRVR